MEQYSKDGSLLYCLLMKALYGLKQGGRQWYLKLSKVMKEIGFMKVRSEPFVYVWEDSTGCTNLYGRLSHHCKNQGGHSAHSSRAAKALQIT